MDPDASSYLILIALILLSGLFSASETALFSLSRAKVEAMVASNVKGALSIRRLKSNPQKMLVVILLGNNLANVGATAFATVLFTELFGSFGVGITTGIMTFLILVFGEVFPKSIATRFPVKISQFIVYPLTMIEYVFFPIVWAFEKVLTLVVGNHIHSVTEEEVVAMVSMGAEEGSLEKHEQEFIENVLEFNDISAESVMTPRTEIMGLEIGTSLSDAVAFACETSFSRIPVYEGDLDHIKGFVTVKKLLSFSMDTNLLDKTLGDIELYEFVKVPPTKTIHSLLIDFKAKGTHIALVLDEHGGVEGIVTLEDVLEEIVGDIMDESDDHEEVVSVIDENSVSVEGDAEIEDIENALQVEIPSVNDKDTIGKVIVDFLKRFPAVNESILIDHVKFTVTEMDAETKRIVKVSVTKLRDE